MCTGIAYLLTRYKVASHPDILHVDLQKGFLVMGSSAGAHLAAVVARRTLSAPLYRSNPVTGQILQVPVTCHPDALPERSSLETLRRNYTLTSA